MNKKLSILIISILFVSAVTDTSVQAINPAFILKATGSWIKWGAKKVGKLLLVEGIVAGVQMLYASRIAAASGLATESGALHKKHPAQCEPDEGLIAPETVPAELANRVIKLINEPERLERVGARLWRGIMLSGLPGTGKTQLGYYIARETGSNVVYEGAAGMIDAAQGSGSRSIHQLFVRAQQKNYTQRIKEFGTKLASWIRFRRAPSKKPTVVIIDEIDAIGLPRGGAIAGLDRARSQERERALEQLLTELDGAHQQSAIPDVFVVATSNRNAQDLDPALVRPGRLKVINVPELSAESRKAIVRYHLGRLQNIRINVDVDQFVDNIAPRASGDYLAHAVNDAAALLADDIQEPKVLTQDLLTRAYNEYRPRAAAPAPIEQPADALPLGGLGVANAK